MAVPSVQHHLPRDPHKFLPNIDPDSKHPNEDHVKYCMLAIRKDTIHHQDVVCKLFPYTFERKSTTQYFTQPQQRIVSQT